MRGSFATPVVTDVNMRLQLSYDRSNTGAGRSVEAQRAAGPGNQGAANDGGWLQPGRSLRPGRYQAAYLSALGVQARDGPRAAAARFRCDDGRGGDGVQRLPCGRGLSD